MADIECNKCIMLEEFKRIWEYNKEEKETRKETEKVVYEMKDIHNQNQFIMKDIQKNLDAQALATEKREAATIIANEKTQDIAIRNHKENKEQFKAIEDRRVSDEKALALKKEAAELAAETERIRVRVAQEATDTALISEKVKQTWTLKAALLVLIIGTLYGWVKTYWPHVVGL